MLRKVQVEVQQVDGHHHEGNGAKDKNRKREAAAPRGEAAEYRGAKANRLTLPMRYTPCN